MTTINQQLINASLLNKIENAGIKLVIEESRLVAHNILFDEKGIQINTIMIDPNVLEELANVLNNSVFAFDDAKGKLLEDYQLSKEDMALLINLIVEHEYNELYYMIRFMRDNINPTREAIVKAYASAHRHACRMECHCIFDMSENACKYYHDLFMLDLPRAEIYNIELSNYQYFMLFIGRARARAQGCAGSLIRILIKDRILTANDYAEARDVAIEASWRLPNIRVLVLLPQGDELYMNGKLKETIYKGYMYSTNNFVVVRK